MLGLKRKGIAVVFSLDRDEVTIGRHRGNNIVISSTPTSRYHCCIVKLNGNYFIKDRQSANGTYINDKLLLPEREMLLIAGDMIGIGCKATEDTACVLEVVLIPFNFSISNEVDVAAVRTNVNIPQTLSRKFHDYEVMINTENITRPLQRRKINNYNSFGHSNNEDGDTGIIPLLDKDPLALTDSEEESSSIFLPNKFSLDFNVVSPESLPVSGAAGYSCISSIDSSVNFRLERLLSVLSRESQKLSKNLCANTNISGHVTKSAEIQAPNITQYDDQNIERSHSSTYSNYEELTDVDNFQLSPPKKIGYRKRLKPSLEKCDHLYPSMKECKVILSSYSIKEKSLRLQKNSAGVRKHNNMHICSSEMCSSCFSAVESKFRNLIFNLKSVKSTEEIGQSATSQHCVSQLPSLATNTYSNRRLKKSFIKSMSHRFTLLRVNQVIPRRRRRRRRRDSIHRRRKVKTAINKSDILFKVFRPKTKSMDILLNFYKSQKFLTDYKIPRKSIVSLVQNDT